jgi:hypothetical protein
MNPSGDVPLRRIRLRRPQAGFEDRLRLLRKRWRLLLRLSIATAGAFFISTHLFGHSQAFFAPISAIIVIVAGAGVRTRTLVELVAGVALGVLVGELLILTIGRGTWQIALVVVLTVIISTLVGIKGLALTQAANSSVLLVAVVPIASAGNPAVTRFIDAFVGGCCGLAMILLVPRDPVRDIDIETQALLRRLSSVLARCAEALRLSDADLADAALTEARAMQPDLQSLESTALNVTEIARMSPMRWKQRDHLGLYVGAVRDRQRHPRRPGAGPSHVGDAAARGGRTVSHAPRDRLARPRRRHLRRRAVRARRLRGGARRARRGGTHRGRGAARRHDDEHRIHRRAGAIARRRPALRQRRDPRRDRREPRLRLRSATGGSDGLDKERRAALASSRRRSP